MDKEQEIEPIDTLLLNSGDALIEIAQNAEKRIGAVKKIKELALAVTNASDWQDEQGKPYLWVSGAEKVARLFNLSWRIGEPEVEEHEDGHFTYHYQGVFSFAKNEIEAIGSRSSRDAFFSRAHNRDIDPATIHRGNVRKAAYTNCIGNGVTRLLGIRNLTWDELMKAGIVKGQTQHIDRSGPKTPNWGKFPKVPLKDVNDQWLTRYYDCALKQLEDKKYAEYLESNKKLVAALNEELDRRADATVTQASEEQPH